MSEESINLRIEKEFVDNIPAISAENQKLLGEKHVLVAGLKGVGGYAFELLTRAGIGNILAADKSEITYADTAKDLFATRDSIGKTRVLVAQEKAKTISPILNFKMWVANVNSATAALALEGQDIVIDGFTDPEDHIMLQDACEKAGVPMIYGGTSGWKTFIMAVTPGSRSLSRFFESNPVPRSRSVLSFTASQCAAMMSAACIAILTGKEPGCLDRIAYTDLSSMCSSLTGPEEKIFDDADISIYLDLPSGLTERKVPANMLIREFMESYEGEFTYMYLNEHLLAEGEDELPLEDGDVLKPNKYLIAGG